MVRRLGEGCRLVCVSRSDSKFLLRVKTLVTKNLLNMENLKDSKKDSI